MTGGEKLRLFAESRGISISAMEKKLGKCNSYLTQVKNVSSDVLMTACELFPELSAEWLLRGTEPMTLDAPNVEDNTDSRKVEILTERLMDAQRKILELELELETRNA